MNRIFQKNSIVLLVTVLGLTAAAGFAVLFWQFWVLFAVVFYAACIFYFSRNLRNFLNIHVVCLSVLFITAAPSAILILLGRLDVGDQYLPVLFSAISVGFMGYVAGVLSLGKIFSLDKPTAQKLSATFNGIYWKIYNYRYLLAAISIFVVFVWGFMPMALSYTDSVKYRMETPGAIQYLNSLIPNVFSVLAVMALIVVGDFSKKRKFSLLSFVFIGLVLLSIIGGHRIWILALIAILMLLFEPYLKRKYVIPSLLIAALLFFTLSGAVRYARSGSSFGEDFQNFKEYFMNPKNINFENMFWGWSDFTTPFSTFITIVENVPQNIGYDFLAPAKDALLLIPTVVYPGRPLPYAQWYIKTFEPELFKEGRGLTFYVIGFGYLFAGPLGVFLHLFLFGALFEWIRRFFRAVGGAPAIFLYGLFFTSLFGFARSTGIVSYAKGLVIDFAVPVFLMFSAILIIDALIPKKGEIL